MQFVLPGLLLVACVAPRGGGLDDDDVFDDDDSALDDDDAVDDDDDVADDDDDATDDDDDAVDDDDLVDACSSAGSGGPTGSGSGSAGGATFSYYVPSGYSPGVPAPVLYTAHGQGGTGEQMVSLWSATAEAEGFIVVGQDSAGEGWNTGSDVEGLSAVFDQAAAWWNVDLCRTYLQGYSAGAHFTYIIGLANADVFAGLAVYAGTMGYAVEFGVWPDMVLRTIPVRIDHGTADSVVPYSEAENAQGLLQGAGHEVSFHAIAGGSHAYDPAVHPDVWAALSQWELP